MDVRMTSPSYEKDHTAAFAVAVVANHSTDGLERCIRVRFLREHLRIDIVYSFTCRFTKVRGRIFAEQCSMDRSRKEENRDGQHLPSSVRRWGEGWSTWEPAALLKYL
jgi:hypothetical protein